MLLTPFFCFWFNLNNICHPTKPPPLWYQYRRPVYFRISFPFEGATECIECPPGRYCLEGKGVQLCPKGYYCLGGTVEDVVPCPPGTYSQQPGQSQVEQCLLCPAGESIVYWIQWKPFLSYCHYFYCSYSFSCHYPTNGYYPTNYL